MSKRVHRESTFEVMLAATLTQPDKLRFPKLASVKLDGIRGYVENAHVYSRNGKRIPNLEVQDMFGRRAFNGLDGELIYGDGTDMDAHRQTGSIVMSRNRPAANVTFYIFDHYGRNEAFWRRLEAAEKLIRDRLNVRMVPHRMIDSMAELDVFEAKALEEGYEGVMLRDPFALYKNGRSTEREQGLLKVKRFEDSEFVIDDAEEFQHNENERDADGKRSSHKAGKVAGGKLGALIGRDIHHGGPVRVGSGFSDKEREDLWRMHRNRTLAGRVGRYKFFPTGTKDRPRFPTWEGFRDDL